MSLSLDDVRNRRFRMARKSGYEVLEVDEFVDEVEETFAQLVEENLNLKKQVESLRSSGPQAAPPVVQPSVSARQAPEAAPAPTFAVPGAVMVTTSKEASSAVVRLVELSTEQAERLVEEATAEADNIRLEANRSAEQVTTDARTGAERVESEARVRAERIQADAAGRAEKLGLEIETRRAHLVGDLEKQRDGLVTTVSALREFEAAYRSNLTSHLRHQIESLESGNDEPADTPAVLGVDPAGGSPPSSSDAQPVTSTGRDEAQSVASGSDSETPRLDALLGDQR